MFDTHELLQWIVVLALLAFMGIWAFVGILIITGVRKTGKWIRRTKHSLSVYGNALPSYPVTPLVKPRGDLNPREVSQLRHILKQTPKPTKRHHLIIRTTEIRRDF